MKITILGSGTSTGVPMVGCHCQVCGSSDPRDKRTRASILVESCGQRILVDTSTDLRMQALREGIPQIDAVLLTHTHADHIHGIDDLRGFHFIHRRVIPCYASQDTIDQVSANFSYIFEGLHSEGYWPLLEAFPVEDPFDLFGCRVTPVPIRHGSFLATGYRFDNAAYLTDCSEIPDQSLALLQGLDLLIIDALRFSPHPNHFNIEGALKITEILKPRRTVLTHLTHEVHHSDGERLPQGVEFAYDGLSVEL
ncbi:GPMC system MBL fold metallohydrolase [Geomonas sp. Red69]|uniref:GPMC system MBL fold metallohydrolase n=1 Tax=Geomonas diazotrophica TaxID=2843197 RepID=A0ABX8JHA9_9BACT|nr:MULTISPECIES: GPMC system MBL fold metallohydrolase [Geomonas]MBU5635188.1 GPMC system MBL fold metallohydrolase [Geomonas diazotrophica]QWV97765.1 GPMC system MBL fold metallohydrolase [Geomonas nitrogeniifigens]QXE86905.1 GPMC system MBL fold metallohydrolase [Geomonas nitrogeniifigens]